jgi:Rad51
MFLTCEDTEGTFRPERIQEIAERFGGIMCDSIFDTTR